MLPKNCLAFKEGSVATFSFDKTFGDNSSSSSPISKNQKEYVMERFREKIKHWKGYEHILGRELQTNEYPNKNNMIIFISPKYKDVNEQDLWNELDKINNGFFQSKLDGI